MHNIVCCMYQCTGIISVYIYYSFISLLLFPLKMLTATEKRKGKAARKNR